MVRCLASSWFFSVRFPPRRSVCQATSHLNITRCGSRPMSRTKRFADASRSRVTVAEPTTSITLHAAEMQFGEVTITSGGRTQKARVTTDATAKPATFTVTDRLGEGPATIQISYTGILNDKCAASISARRTDESTR
jgi:hypothetical protein